MGPGLPEGKVLTTLGVQLVGDRDSLKTLTPAQHGTSTYGRVRKKVGLISKLYFPVMETLSEGHSVRFSQAWLGSSGRWAVPEPLGGGRDS